MTRIGILGSGEVGKTLAKGLKSHGYDVRIATRTGGKLDSFSAESGIPFGSLEHVAAWAEGIVLAVAGRGAKEALHEAGAANFAGKCVMDVTNPIEVSPPEDGVLRFFTGPNDSLMEQLQKEFPDAHFVKAFNSVGNARMVNPSYAGGPPTMFYCGNDPQAKQVVAGIISALGWEGWDMGTAKAARAIEPLCMLWCIPGFREHSWTHAFKILKG